MSGLFGGNGLLGGLTSGITNALFGSPQQAATPDYAQAAKETAAGNLAAAQYATIANRSNQYNPYGSLTWQKGATENDPWTQTVNFTPEGQKLFDLQNQGNMAYAQAANQGFQNIKGLFENPNIDESKLTAMPINAGVNAQEAIMSRLRPQLQKEQEALDAKLANQGITLGSDAYSRSQNLQGQRMNDLELQSALQGIGLDMNARQQGLNEQYQRMQQPLNMINALRSGSQVQAPQFGTYAQQQTTQGADLNSAAKNQYGASWDMANFNNAQREQNMQTASSLAGLFSDKRVKTNIKAVGKTDSGLTIYTYNYVWGGPTQMGVMAQDVEKTNPEAVGEVNGIKFVDYSKVM